MIKRTAHFVRATKRGHFLLSRHFLYVLENSDHVQPVVVFCCKHNVAMRILNKTQLILESNLDFQGFINIIQTHPEIQPAVEFGLRFLIFTTFWMPRHVSALWGRFNMTIYQVVNHDKFNPRLYFMSFLCGWRNTDKCFCRPTHLRMRQKTATMFNHRLCYLANTTSQCEFRLKYNLY